MVRNFWTLFIAVLLALCTLGCGRCDPSSSTKTWRNKENVLRIDLPAPFGPLDPASDAAAASTMVFPLLYSYLFVPNDEGRLEADLAIQWYYNSDNFTWTVHLRNDALFHDGRSVTAQDVEWSLRSQFRVQRPILYSMIDQIARVTETCIRVRLNQDDPSFVMKIWDMPITPDPRGRTADYDNHPIGSGPFKFKSRNGETEVGLTAYESYFGGRPLLDGVVFHFEPDTQRSWARLLSGSTDIAPRLQPKDWEITGKYSDRFYFDALVHDTYTLLLYNTTHPLFADQSVRLALAHAVDRQSMVDEIFHGAAAVAIGPAGVNSPYHHPELRPVQYDPARAVELLRRAGWVYNSNEHLLYREGKRFEFTILIFEGSRTDRNVAERLQLFLNDVGIKTCIQSLQQNELVRRYAYNNEFQALLTEFVAPTRVPEILSQLWGATSWQGSFAGLFSNPQVDSLLYGTAQNRDPVIRKALYWKLDALLASLQPGMFLFHKTYFNVMSKRVRFPLHFSFDIAGTYRLKYASFEAP
jgi:peptide/nickel transport system substrate-binding protein